MIRSINKAYPFYIIIDLMFIVLSFFLSYILRYHYFLYFQTNLPYQKEYIFLFILWAIFIVTSFKRRGLYSTDRNLTIPAEISKVVIATFYVSVLMATIIFFAKYSFFSRKVFFLNFCLLCFFLSGWRVIKRLVLRKLILEGFHNINILIVGANKVGKIALEEIRKNPWWGFKVAGFVDDIVEERIDEVVPILGKLKDFPAITKKHFIDEVIIALGSEKKSVSELMILAKSLNVGVRMIPENFEEPVRILDVNYLGIIPLLTYKIRTHHPTEFFLKRMFDLVISVFLIIVLFPLFIIISILIKLDSPGPVFFVQKRVGLKKRTFDLYKFRSMINEADSLKPTLLEKNEVRDGVIFKMKQDPRITNLGVLLRRFSLDELPQLFNVFNGEMSLVGPRPPTLDEVEKYNHFHMDRLSIRPGMTGLSQVKGRSELTFKNWVRWDLWYLNNWSFTLDLQIILWTIPVIFTGKGAY